MSTLDPEWFVLGLRLGQEVDGQLGLSTIERQRVPVERKKGN
jgi:hypothetical protein